jgi:hypothetical protein
MADINLDPLTKLVVTVEHLAKQHSELKVEMVKGLEEVKTGIANAANQFASAKDMTDVELSLREKVSKEEFDPVKRLVYGLVTVVLTGVIAALLAMLFNSARP